MSEAPAEACGVRVLALVGRQVEGRMPFAVAHMLVRSAPPQARWIAAQTVYCTSGMTSPVN